MKRFLLCLVISLFLVPSASAKPYLTMSRAVRAIGKAVAVDQPRSYTVPSCSRRSDVIIQCHVVEYGSLKLLTDNGVPIATDLFILVRVKMLRNGHVTVWWDF